MKQNAQHQSRSCNPLRFTELYLSTTVGKFEVFFASTATHNLFADFVVPIKAFTKLIRLDTSPANWKRWFKKALYQQVNPQLYWFCVSKSISLIHNKTNILLWYKSCLNLILKNINSKPAPGLPTKINNDTMRHEIFSIHKMLFNPTHTYGSWSRCIGNILLLPYMVYGIRDYFRSLLAIAHFKSSFGTEKTHMSINIYVAFGRSSIFCQ